MACDWWRTLEYWITTNYWTFFFVYSLMLNQLSPIYKWTNLLLICMKEQFSSWNSGHWMEKQQSKKKTQAPAAWVCVVLCFVKMIVKLKIFFGLGLLVAHLKTLQCTVSKHAGLFSIFTDRNWGLWKQTFIVASLVCWWAPLEHFSPRMVLLVQWKWKGSLIYIPNTEAKSIRPTSQ